MGWEWVEIAFQIKGTETEEWFGSISSLFHSKVWNMMYCCGSKIAVVR